jgi:hypothetical protein
VGLFNRNKEKEQDQTTKCKECGLELHDPERLKRHLKKAHGNVPEKKFDPKSGDPGLW